jgi:2'-5' RNA ligase
MNTKGWTFNPHQTLAYRKGEPFQCDLESIHWEVDEFVLVHSHVGLGRHDTIAQWPLRAINAAQLAIL